MCMIIDEELREQMNAKRTQYYSLTNNYHTYIFTFPFIEFFIIKTII